MGTWGFGNFENDDAIDWICDLAGSKNLKTLLAPLHDVISETDYIEAPLCSRALASAEVVKGVLSGAPSALPEEARKWVKKKQGFFGKPPEKRVAAEHALLAAKAVQKITAGSELKELWEETEDSDKWFSRQEELLAELNGLCE